MRASPTLNKRFTMAPLAAAIALVLAPAPALALPHFVTNNGDNGGVNPLPLLGTGTLRQAIVDANTACAVDPNPAISFAIGTSAAIIALQAPLPALQCGILPYSPTIDASLQPGSMANSGTSNINATHGITIDGSAISQPACGLSFPQGSPSFGTMTVRGIAFDSFFYGANSGICGTALNIYGNRFTNSSYGVTSSAASPFAPIIGTTSPADRNWFQSCFQAAISISGAGQPFITNNFIGTDASGTVAVGNGRGIQIAGSALTTISGNLISGNFFSGIEINNQQVALMDNNKIGVGSSGGALGNATGITVNNTALPGAATINISPNNEIAYNTTFGVNVLAGTNVWIFNSSIHSNGTKNVSLGSPLQDLQDPDGGPNNGQNYPNLTTVTSNGVQTNVRWTFNSLPNTSFDFYLYANPAPGIPAGRTFVGSYPGTTDANGDYNLYDTLGGVNVSPALNHFSVVASRQAVEVSEFSPIVSATGAPAVNVSSNALSFGNVPIGTTSANLTSTLTSTGPVPYLVSNVGSPFCYGGPVCYGGAEFSCSTTCAVGTPYTLNQTCTVTGNFHPTMLGAQSVTVQVCDNATGSPRNITLSGTGVPAGIFSLSPTSFDFGDAAIGTQSPRAIFSLQNPSPSPAAFATSTSGPFQVLATTCSNPVPAGGSCDFDVVFAPGAGGPASGLFTVSPAAGAPASAVLAGNGTVEPLLRLPVSLDFNFLLGTAPLAQSFVLQNFGSAPLAISSLSISGTGFTLTHDCPASLAPGASCTLLLTFFAAERGEYLGALSIATNARGGVRTIGLRGLSQPRAVPVLEVKPVEIGFGDQALGTASDSETITIRNIGGAPAVFDSLVASPDFVILRHTCTAPLEPLKSCEALVAMRALGYGTRSGKFVVNSNAENGPNAVNIFGTGCRGAGLSIARVGVTRGCAP